MADLPLTSSILDEFNRHKRQGERIALPYRQLGELCEMFVGGRQWGVYSGQRR